MVWLQVGNWSKHSTAGEVSDHVSQRPQSSTYPGPWKDWHVGLWQGVVEGAGPADGGKWLSPGLHELEVKPALARGKEIPHSEVLRVQQTQKPQGGKKGLGCIQPLARSGVSLGSEPGLWCWGVRLSLAPRRGRDWGSLAVKYTQNPCPHQRSPGLGTGMQGAVISSGKAKSITRILSEQALCGLMASVGSLYYNEGK